MSDALPFYTQLNPTTGASEYVDKTTGNVIFSLRSGDPADTGRLYSVEGNATTAQINAGLTVVAAQTGVTLVPVSIWLRGHGNAAGATDIRVSDTAASPVDVVTVAVANIADTVIVTDAGGTGITLGAGFLAALTAAKGIQIRKTGSTLTGTTSVDFRILFRAQ